MSNTKASEAYSESTADRIRAYLASMRLVEGCEWADDVDAQIQRGRSLIEQLALSARGEDLPRMKLSPSQCADVLQYMSCSQPIDLNGWWKDKGTISHVCGLTHVLDAMRDSLRGLRGRS